MKKTLSFLLVSTMILPVVLGTTTANAETTKVTADVSEVSKEKAAVKSDAKVVINASDFEVSSTEDLTKWTNQDWKQHMKLSIIDTETKKDHADEYLMQPQISAVLKGIAKEATGNPGIYNITLNFEGAESKLVKMTVKNKNGENPATGKWELSVDMTNDVNISTTDDHKEGVKAAKDGIGEVEVIAKDPKGNRDAAMEKELKKQIDDGINKQLEEIDYTKANKYTIKGSAFIKDEKGVKVAETSYEISLKVDDAENGGVIENGSYSFASKETVTTVASKEPMSQKDFIKESGMKVTNTSTKSDVTDSFFEQGNSFDLSNVDWSKSGTYTATLVDKDGKPIKVKFENTSEPKPYEIKVVVAAQTPSISASDVTLKQTTKNEVDLLDWAELTKVKVEDSLEGDLTKEAKFDLKGIDTTVKGEQVLKISVENKNGGTATKDVKVTITGDEKPTDPKDPNGDGSGGVVDGNVDSDKEKTDNIDKKKTENSTGTSSEKGKEGNKNSGQSANNSKTGNNSAAKELSQTDKVFNSKNTLIGSLILALSSFGYVFTKKRTKDK